MSWARFAARMERAARRVANIVVCVAAAAAVSPLLSLAAQAKPQADVQPPSARAPIAPSLGAEPGAELDVYVMTMGQGDEVYERFGHNALGIRNRRTGEDIVYNWGMFSFDQPGFIQHFLRGLNEYWMAGFDASMMLQAYQRFNRSVTVQDLNLTNAQKAALRDFVEWNARDENKFYRYDYYRDNCSTRVRDALDKALGGAIRQVAEKDVTTMTYRDHSLRLTDGMFWTRTGIDLALGAFTDRPITSWETMFIPMELQRRLRDIRVKGAGGVDVPLVSNERVLFSATRPAERMTVPNDVGVFLFAGVALGALLVLLAYRTKGSAAPLSVSLVWSTLAGILGLLLFLLWTVTEHISAYKNQNLFFVNPLWLVVAALLPLAGARRSVRDKLLLVVRICAVLTLCGAVLALTPLGQPSGAIAAFVAPFNLAVYLVILRVVYLAQQRANATIGAS